MDCISEVICSEIVHIPNCCTGSVNGANCKELAGQPDVDGFLVGGASLKVSNSCSLNKYDLVCFVTLIIRIAADSDSSVYFCY